MTLEEAILVAGRDVANASPNLTIERFHETVKSLVVRCGFGKNEYHTALTVNQWRSHFKEEPNMEKVDEGYFVVITMASRDAFGG